MILNVVELELLSSAHAVIADTGRSVTAMHSATRRLSSRFFIGGPSLSLGRKWSSGKNGCSYFLKYTPREILSPFFKKIEKKKKNQNAEVVASPDNGVQSLDKSFKIDYTTNRKGADEQCLVSFPFLVDQKRLTV